MAQDSGSNHFNTTTSCGKCGLADGFPCLRHGMDANAHENPNPTATAQFHFANCAVAVLGAVNLKTVTPFRKKEERLSQYII